MSAAAVQWQHRQHWQHRQQCKWMVGWPVTWPDRTDRHWAGGLRCKIRHNPWRSTRMTWLVHTKCQVQLYLLAPLRHGFQWLLLYSGFDANKVICILWALKQTPAMVGLFNWRLTSYRVNGPASVQN